MEHPTKALRSEAEVVRLQKLQADHQAAFAANDQPLVARLGHEFHRMINLTAGTIETIAGA